MWTLIWIFAAANGTMATGVNTFPSQRACEAARAELTAMADAAVMGSAYQSRREILCLDQESGRAAAHPERPAIPRRVQP